MPVTTSDVTIIFFYNGLSGGNTLNGFKNTDDHIHAGLSR